MEKIQFMYALAVIVLFALLFVLLLLNRVIAERDAHKNNSLMFEALYQQEKESAKDYKQMYVMTVEKCKKQEEIIEMLNDEVARYHGRRTAQSYYRKMD